MFRAGFPINPVQVSHNHVHPVYLFVSLEMLRATFRCARIARAAESSPSPEILVGGVPISQRSGFLYHRFRRSCTRESFLGAPDVLAGARATDRVAVSHCPRRRPRKPLHRSNTQSMYGPAFDPAVLSPLQRSAAFP